jgi:acetyl esterase/lipase
MIMVEVGATDPPSTQSRAVTRYWAAAREALARPDAGQPGAGQPGDESWGDLTAEPREVDYVETDAGGLPAMWVSPKRRARDAVLLCMHGGGFVAGSIYSHRKLFGQLAKATGARALIFDYRLAPAHPHPSQVDDATEVYRWLLGQNVTADRIAFVGDSCGGGLCVTTQLRARQRRLPLPAVAMPFSPWVDMAARGESYETNRDRDAFFSAPLVRELAAGFLGADGDPRDPLANPLHADLSGLAPMYIQVGGDEVLLDDARRLAAHARRAGVEVRLDVFPGMQHTFQMAAGRAPEADDAIRRMAAWARPRLGLGGAGLR